MREIASTLRPSPDGTSQPVDAFLRDFRIHAYLEDRSLFGSSLPMRRAALPALARIKPTMVLEDATVPQVEDVVEAARATVGRRG